MHVEAFEWLRSQASDVKTVVEIGSRDINGSPRPLFPGAEYVGVDVREGKGVDVVADATQWKPDKKVDLVVCAEVLEHVENPEAFVTSAAAMLKTGGVFLVTAACNPREPHSAVDGGQIRDSEHYANVDPDELLVWLDDAGFDAEVSVDSEHGDVYGRGVKRGRKPKPR
jgi:SAM-dependent methyltransferase